ncbi:MAG: YgiQ family radical SAM protein [Deltaproteobacteria bacterium]|nr:MAG: YgiQ family radical SAM protein [Deltaproteobacteria bacterium]
MASRAPAPPASGFLPTSRAEMTARGWTELDVLFVTGDAYIDHPAFGTPLLARLLEAEGYRVGILAQPDWRNPEALREMGRPRLFAAISAGAMDSMVNRYTAAKKVRNDDAFTPGGRAGARPDRAVIAYTAAIKGAFKGVPTLIGGIEASLRRLAHYDYWDDKVRRSVLVDSKADLLLYGMAESALLEVARRLQAGQPLAEIRDVRGTAFLAKTPPDEAVVLPAFAAVAAEKGAYNSAFRLAANEANPFNGRRLAQLHGERWVVVNPPPLPLTEAELDRIYALPFTRLPHPAYTETIPAYEQIKFSLTAHRGCFGGCAFCAIAHHQGKTIQSRSPASLRGEVDRLAAHPEFRGTISDLGGPTANMYGLGCGDPAAQAACRRPSCLYPGVCRHLVTADRRAVGLLRDLRAHPAVKHLFVASGVRFDLLERQPDYFADLLEHHVGGLLKVAPETVAPRVAEVMRKPGPQVFEGFLDAFRDRSRRLGRRQAVVPYFISGHPGCTLADMVEVALFLKRHQLKVEQVQEFTPTPGSLATCIYHTGHDPFTNEPVYVPRSPQERRLQKALLLWHLPENRDDVREALRRAKRPDASGELLGDTGRHTSRRLPARKPTPSPRRGS